MKRVELSRALSIRKSSISNIMRDLIDEGLVRETRPQSARSPVALHTGTPVALVASLRPDRIETATVALDGSVADMVTAPLLDHLLLQPSVSNALFSHATATPVPPLDALGASMETLAARTDRVLLGAGVAVPGLVDTAGIGLRAAHLPHWSDVPVRDTLATRLRHLVVVENDVRCALQGRLWFDPPSPDCRDLLYVAQGDGVGAAIVAAGRFVRGAHHGAGEIGHLHAGDEGRACHCGKRDCLETYLSAPALLQEIRALAPHVPLQSPADLPAHADTCPAIGNVLDRNAGRLAEALAGLVSALDPDAIVLGGPYPALGALLQPCLQKHLAVRLGLPRPEEVPVLVDDAGDKAELRGAAAFVFEQAFRWPASYRERIRTLDHAEKEQA